MSARRALITGVTGQDGIYLARLLLEQGYAVHGAVRADSKSGSDFELADALTLHTCDLQSEAAVRELLSTVRPQEVYNLAAQSSVPVSFEQPIMTADVNGLAVPRLLEAIRAVDADIRFCQASSSEMFGYGHQELQDELTPFRPRSPYGVAKLYGHWMAVAYREKYGLFACNAILFNHESPLRRPEFVTRKISLAVARIKHGLQEQLVLGDLDAQRDWGFAGDYVHAMWLMLTHDSPDDYVLATGQQHSVREFCELAFSHVGLNWHDHVVVDETLHRPARRVDVGGDAGKAKRQLGWKPEVSFEELVRMMVDADVRQVADAAV